MESDIFCLKTVSLKHSFPAYVSRNCMITRARLDVILAAVVQAHEERGRFLCYLCLFNVGMPMLSNADKATSSWVTDWAKFEKK